MASPYQDPSWNYTPAIGHFVDAVEASSGGSITIEVQFAFGELEPDIDELTGGVLGTRAGLAQLFELCAADPECDRAYPDLEQAWEAALGRLSRAPLTGEYEAADGRTIDVVVDAGKLLRVARFTLGDDGPRTLRHLPAIISAAAAGEAAPKLLEIVANDPLFCVGYRPLCSGQVGRDFSLGAYLTMFCRYQLPHLDHAELADAIGAIRSITPSSARARTSRRVRRGRSRPPTRVPSRRWTATSRCCCFPGSSTPSALQDGPMRTPRGSTTRGR